MISCPLCTKVFSCLSRLNTHVVSHTKEKPHKCHICSAAYGDKYTLKNHVQRAHDGINQKNMHCSLCNYKCYCKYNFRRHVRTHSAEKKFTCSIPSCRFETKQKIYLQRHVRAIHSNAPPCKCPSDGCSYTAKNMVNLKCHLKRHSNDTPIKCQYLGCNYRCKLNGNLKAHTSRMHTDQKPFKCSNCDFRAINKSSVMLHERTHDKVKRFRCQAPNCDYASHQEVQLKEHFDRKHGQKNLLCTKRGCNFSCGDITRLRGHLKCHESPILKCPCDSCYFRTRVKRVLLSHISLRHEDISEGNEDGKRKHVCMFCSSRFTSHNGLRDHLQRHTAEKPYKCSFCNYTTAFTIKLRRHAWLMHNINVIPRGNEDEVKKCPTCNTIFWSYSELVLHSMSHLQPVVVMEQLKLQVM